MDELAFIIGTILLVGAVLLVMPIVAIVLAVKARRQARIVQEELRKLDERFLYWRIQSHPKFADAEATPTRAVDTGALEPAPAAAPLEPPVLDQVQLEAEPEVKPAPVANEAPRLPPPAPPAGTPTSLEETIGLVWGLRLGALIGILVAGYAFKYVVDNDLIGPWGRVLLGIGAGMGMLIWGEFLIRGKKTHAVFTQGALGLGLALLFVTAYAAAAYYHLLSELVAFGIVAGLALFGGALAAFHRAQAILMLTLVAVFLNPVMLSTGVDRPLALFSYLLVMTGGALWVAQKMDFRLVAWLAVAGVAALFAGWFATFFNASPPPEPGVFDAAPERLQGAYFPLLSRWVPLLFAILFPALWSLAGRLFGQRRKPHTATGLFLAAAIAAHAAMAALLFDHALLLGGVLCALGVAFSFLLIRADRAPWLGLPMLASFAVLAALTGRIETDSLLPMMGLTGVLSAIYFGTTCRTALAGGWLQRPMALWLLGGAGLGLAVMGLLWLMPEHYGLFGALLIGLSLVFLWLTLFVRAAIMLIMAFLVSLVGVGLSATQSMGAVDAGMLVVSGIWFLVYVGGISIDLFVRGSPWSTGRLAMLTAAGVGFAAMFLTATDGEQGILRSLLSLGAGFIYLLIGLRMRLSGRPGEAKSMLSLGLAVAFFTLALALMLPGQTVTLAWALEAGILFWLSARSHFRGRPGHPGWLAAAAIVLLIAISRLIDLDADWLVQQAWSFKNSHGEQGTLLATPFLHPLAWSLLALGASMLASAMFIKRHVSRRLFRLSAGGLVLLGHLALLLLVIHESRLLATPAPPIVQPGVVWEEFLPAIAQWEEGVYAMETRLDMLTTVVMGLVAFVLLGLGFGLRERFHRLLGMGLFGLTLLKLGLWDIWSLETIYKITVGGAIAALLLAGAFLYGRFSHRIRSMLQEGGKTLGMFLLLTGFLAATEARADQPDVDHRPVNQRYADRADIDGITAPGLYRFELGLEWYAHSLSSIRFQDLRILDSSGQEAAFLIRRMAPPPPPPRSREVRVLDPLLMPDGASRAVLDLGPDPPEHAHVDLDISGHDYLRATRLESSPDGTTFGLLKQGAYVFDVQTGGPRQQRTWIDYPASRSRYLRVSLLPGNDGQRLTIRSARVRKACPPGSQPAFREIELAIADSRQDDKKRSLVELQPLPKGVPVSSLRLKVDSSEFVRRVSVEATTQGHAWFAAGGGVVFRVGPGAAPDEHLELGLSNGDRPRLRLVIENGDDPPLKIGGAWARYQPQEVLFRANDGKAHHVYVGYEKEVAARYDLAAVLQRSKEVELHAASPGGLQANPEWTAKHKKPDHLPWTERHAWLIQLIIGLVVLALVFWTIRLLRKTPSN